MPKLRDILAATAETQVEYGGQTITVTYRPGAYTVRLVESLQDAGIHEVLPQLVEKWDLEGDDDQLLPVTAATLAELPLPLIRAVWLGIRDALSPNSTSETNSGSG